MESAKWFCGLVTKHNQKKLEGNSSFFSFHLKRLFENLENLVTKSPLYGIIEKKYVLENTHGDNNGL